MSGLQYNFDGGTIEFVVIIPGERFEVRFNGETQYVLGNGTVFIQRLLAKQLGIPAWDSSPQPFDTNSMKSLD